MKEWFTAREIAELKLPGLPTTGRNISEKAGREGWPSRERAASGGGREYPIAALPTAARDEYVRRQMGRAVAIRSPASVPAVAPEAPRQSVAELKDWQRRIMDARLVLVREVLRLARVGGKTRAVELLVAEGNAGTLAPELQDAVQAASAKKGERAALSARTLWRWIKDFEASEGKASALAPAPSPREQVVPPAWLSDFMDFYALPSKPSITIAARECAKARPDIALPAVRTIQWTIAKVPALARERGRMGPRALRQMKAFVRRDVSELWPTAVYVTDGHTHHAMTAHPLTGKPFRPEITSTIDVVTRRNVGWSVGLAENTFGTIDALRHAFATSGVPDIWYVDRGSGFNNAVFDDRMSGLLARFDVEKHTGLPYRSQARGVIERHHQTWIEAARLLPSYVGTDMDTEARKRVDKAVAADLEAYGSSRLLQSWPDFIAWMGGEVAAYNARPHSALPKVTDAQGRKRHMSPDECWASWVAQGWAPDIVDADDADFRPQEKRRVMRAEIQIFTNRYFAVELEEFHERDVLVAYDIHDASKVWVSTLNQQFICVATYYGNSVSYFPRTVVEQAHEKRVENRLKRVERKRLAVAEEAQPPTLTLAASGEEPAIAALPAASPILTVVAENAPADPARRPNFGDDVDMAKWLIAHADQITGHDARHLLDRMRSSTFRLRLQADDVDPAALTCLLKPLSSQEKAL
ncbi:MULTISPECIES: Mu transposase C-terminal domain-containing protein [unclassified Xanthobacter]|uniref:Mu transposase C-terminal domain-containing protein n=1 Tax=unclassified Xanthobacter TaxID=2623496 RepID=UPI001EDFC01C|nr:MULTISPECIES: Mu transposase C-terminal domain-containing protein [unclassified Xanthobacter]